MSEQPAEHPAKLDKAFAGGVAWSAAAKWISQLVSWPAVIVTANVLTTADFGTVDMAGFYFTMTNVLAEFGVGTAVLQLRELKEDAIAQMNTVSLMFGTAACLATLVLAPVVAAFFQTPELTLLMRVASISFVMIGLQAVPTALMQRALDYRKLSISEALQATVQALVTVGSALLGMGYWALAIGGLSGRLVSLLLTRYWTPVSFQRPDWSVVFKPMQFGVEIALQRLVWVFYLQSDAIVVGRTMGQSVLGTYRMAINLATAPADKIGTLVMRVTGPLFARIQDDRDMTLRYFLLLTEMLSLALFPLVLGLAIVAPEAIHLLLSPAWDGAITPLRWLTLFTLIRTLNSLGNQVLIAFRFTRFTSWITGANTIMMPLTFLGASFYGAGWVAAGWVVMSPFTTLPSLLKVLKELNCGWKRYLGTFVAPTTASVAMVGALLTLRSGLASRSPAMQLAVEVPLGGVVYGGILLLFFRSRITRYVGYLKRLRQSPDVAVAAEIL